VSQFFIRRPIVAIVIAILMVIMGAFTLLRLSFEQYPFLAPPIIRVTATYPGASAIAVEQSVATPIEQEVNGVDRMIYMQSSNTSDGRAISHGEAEVRDRSRLSAAPCPWSRPEALATFPPVSVAFPALERLQPADSAALCYPLRATVPGPPAPDAVPSAGFRNRPRATKPHSPEPRFVHRDFFTHRGSACGRPSCSVARRAKKPSSFFFFMSSTIQSVREAAAMPLFRRFAFDRT